jgi:hypothetical protein
MGSQNIMGSDYGSNISAATSTLRSSRNKDPRGQVSSVPTICLYPLFTTQDHIDINLYKF